ncbi:MAG TPA: response regulator transcription factor [Acidimicrobiales bacterium]|jgi:two-component system, NarL family, nitrate/nitrite response regulator NarL|nr:response regulator transcription factor [Acidimicrobiales bacterium]HVM03068.1 response regulator transcription factor [Acidimicrobiales bacterium]
MGAEPLRLLLVDDHDLLSGALSLALRARGLDVATSSGPAATDVVDAARRRAPVVVLLDLDLGPLGSGLDLVGPLVEAGAVVVMLTGVTDRAQLAACVEAGAAGLLAKTIPFDDLIEAVATVANRGTLLDQAGRDELLADLRAKRAADRRRLAAFEALTARERAVLAQLVEGRSAEAVAAASFVSVATVRSQIQAILRKLGVNSQLAAVALARDAGFHQ